MQVTAAHEYNHVLQYAYDTRQDTWMFEATATSVGGEGLRRRSTTTSNYMDVWADLPDEPLTSAGDGFPVGR